MKVSEIQCDNNIVVNWIYAYLTLAAILNMISKRQIVMTKRPEQITADFLLILDKNLQELIEGKTDEYLDIHKIAELLFIHPTHLSNTIKNTTGKSPCGICNDKTITISKKLLAETNLTITEIAFKLTYEPSNFTKYFKKFAGITPSQYRASLV